MRSLINSLDVMVTGIIVNKNGNDSVHCDWFRDPWNNQSTFCNNRTVLYNYGSRFVEVANSTIRSLSWKLYKYIVRQDITCFYESRRSTVGPTKSRHFSLSRTTWIQTTFSHAIYWYKCLPSRPRIFPLKFPDNIFETLLNCIYI